MNIFKRSAYATVSQLKRNQCTILSILGHFRTILCLFLRNCVTTVR